ncbi:MAG: SH3 domain-containing protein [Bacteriovorax sp.]|nr:SH3 domain-containing protein [Bacteriovorax sp.]
MKKIICLLLLIMNSSLSASDGMKKSLLGVRYFSEMMGNVHQNPSRYSQVITTISCNHPVKIMKEVSKDGKEFILYGEDKWNFVSVGPYEGYLMADYLTEKKNDCFEEQYSKFFDGLNLDINDLYYWARLYDQYVQGKSKVRK